MMINLSFFTDLLVLPLRGVLLFSSLLGGNTVMRIRRWIWMVTRDVDDARRLLSLYGNESRNTLRSTIDELSEISRDCAHVALLVSYEFRVSRDVDYVRAWIDRAQKEEYGNRPMLRYLELILCDPQKDPDRAMILSSEILDRGDYPAEVSYTALYNRFLALIRLKRLDEAEAISDRVSSVSNDDNSLLYQTILRIARGDDNVDDLLDRMTIKDENQRKILLARAHRDAGVQEADDDL